MGLGVRPVSAHKNRGGEPGQPRQLPPGSHEASTSHRPLSGARLRVLRLREVKNLAAQSGGFV